MNQDRKWICGALVIVACSSGSSSMSGPNDAATRADATHDAGAHDASTHADASRHDSSPGHTTDAGAPDTGHAHLADGSVPDGSDATLSDSGTPKTNCLRLLTPESATEAATFDSARLEVCGYPAPCAYPCQDSSPYATGVPMGTTLTTVASIQCAANGTVSGVRFVGSASDISLGTGCTLKDSYVEFTDGPNGPGIRDMGVHLVHDEITGGLTGSACTNPTGSLVGGGGTTVSYSYLHCSAEDLQLTVSADHSFITSDGPCSYYGDEGCGSAVPHYETLYSNSGNTTTITLVGNTLVNPQPETATIFLDTHFGTPPLENVVVHDNLLGNGGDNGAIAAGCDTLSGPQTPQNLTFTDNRFAFFSTNVAAIGSGQGNAGGIDTNADATGPGLTKWSGNYSDSDLSTVDPQPGGVGCGFDSDGGP